MAKPDPALLDPARYPHRTAIEPRFGDLDANLHVNSVALAGIMEEARIRLHRQCGFNRLLQDGVGAMVVSFAIEYLGETYYPEPVEVLGALERIGGSSHTLIQLVRQKERTVAFSRAVIVAAGAGKAISLPDEYREDAGKWMIRP
jgi:acyl-CoA thioester hydrolase